MENNHPPPASSLAPNMIMNSFNDGFVGFKITAENDHLPHHAAHVIDEMKPFGGTSKKKAAREKQIRKPIKFAFQTRSIVDILDDGYRWRKYGQKAVKTKKFPRSYYRCTYDGCNVKKQVQRSCRDEGVVVTTYEGRHTHPLEKALDNFEHILNQMQIYPTR